MKDLRWGLVGATTVARDWMVPAIREIGGSIASVLSASPERGAAFANSLDVPGRPATLDELLGDRSVEAVYISTTNELHVPQAMAALAAGKHVLCEKPLSTSLAGAQRMVAAADTAGLVLATNHHLRNAGTHRAMRDAIAAGRIGRPLFVKVAHAIHLPETLQGWRVTSPEKGGGVVLDITCHDVDTLRFLLDDDPKDVVCVTQQAGLGKGDVEDGAMVTIRFRNGVVAQTHDAFTVKHGRTGLEVHGTDGSLIATDCMTQRPIGEVTLRTASGEEALPVDRGNLYERGLRAFSAAVAGRGSPAATGRDGLWSLSTALAALESSRFGRRVDVQP